MVLVDLECPAHHRTAELLPDKEGKALVNWLNWHRGVESSDFDLLPKKYLEFALQDASERFRKLGVAAPTMADVGNLQRPTIPSLRLVPIGLDRVLESR
jgi:hypothetical protein